MLAGQLEPEDVHQFGDGRLGGHVMAAEHADPLQAESRFVEFHHDPTAPALRDVEDDQSPVDRLFEYAGTRLFAEKAHLALNDGTMFGQPGEGFMRLNIGCPRSVLKQALQQLREAVVQ